MPNTFQVGDKVRYEGAIIEEDGTESIGTMEGTVHRVNEDVVGIEVEGFEDILVGYRRVTLIGGNVGSVASMPSER